MRLGGLMNKPIKDFDLVQKIQKTTDTVSHFAKRVQVLNRFQSDFLKRKKLKTNKK